MILLDANFLISLAETSSDATRLHTFLSSLGRNQVIGIPAPCWGEFLSGSGSAASTLAGVVRARSSIQVVPFDEIAAVESSFIDQDIRQRTGSKKGKSTAAWQKIKIDRQILAIASVHRATAIYTDDDNLIADAHLLGITTVRLSEVPRIPVQIPLLEVDNPTGDIPASEPSGGSW